MPDNASRRGAVDMGMVLMIVAFATIGGFLYWLSGQAAAERAAAEVVEETVDEMPDTGVPAVAGEDIQMDATPFEGQEIRLATFNIASALGSQGFWLEMPNGNPVPRLHVRRGHGRGAGRLAGERRDRCGRGPRNERLHADRVVGGRHDRRG